MLNLNEIELTYRPLIDLLVEMSFSLDFSLLDFFTLLLVNIFIDCCQNTAKNPIFVLYSTMCFVPFCLFFC